jgi:hypothetical protein
MLTFGCVRYGAAGFLDVIDRASKHLLQYLRWKR